MEFGGPGTSGTVEFSIDESGAEVLFDEDHLLITATSANIRSEPSTESEIVVTARKGDIVELVCRKGDWYEVTLFSGEYRYVYGSLADPTVDLRPLPQEERVRREVFRMVMLVTEATTNEADARYPLTGGGVTDDQIHANTALQRRLLDRRLLEMCHKEGIHSGLIDRISLEGAVNNW